MSSACVSAEFSKVSEPVLEPLRALSAELRARGAHVGVGELIGAHRALAAVNPASREEAKLALRAVMCSDHADLARFEAAFTAVFGKERPAAGKEALERLGTIEREALPRVAVPASGEIEDANELMPVPVAWSDIELLRTTDFAAYTEREAMVARELIERLARRGPTRRSRRTRPSPRRGHAPDVRRTLRASLRSGGEPVHRQWRAPSTRPRPLILLCDVSGSMAPYARMLLQYAQAAVTARRRVEAFAFGTRLTRITNELTGRDYDRALERATAAVVDYAGGTRIGEALAELNRVHGRRIGRGAVVVILSDGWDRGDPALLEAEIARLRRSAHRLLWLNPLAAHPEYRPLTQGMRAAMPHSDLLLAANSLASLEELADILEDT